MEHYNRSEDLKWSFQQQIIQFYRVDYRNPRWTNSLVMVHHSRETRVQIFLRADFQNNNNNNNNTN